VVLGVWLFEDAAVPVEFELPVTAVVVFEMEPVTDAESFVACVLWDYAF